MPKDNSSLMKNGYLPYAVGLVGLAGFMYSVPSILKKLLEDDYIKIDDITAEGASFVNKEGIEVRTRALPPDESAEGDETALKKKDKKDKKAKKGEIVCTGDIEDMDKVCGFLRPKTKDVHNTVEPYEKHFFVCSGKREWPTKVEDDEKVGALMKVLHAEKKILPTKIKITVCDLRSKNPEGIDILVFPDMMRFYNIRPIDVPVLFNFLNPNYNRSSGDVLSFAPIRGTYVFICAHGTKDNRCGYCGPILVDEFNAQLDGRSDVQVSAVTHVGGHGLAGNVLIFPPGDWLGYVAPQNVPEIIKAHINEGGVVQELWRGRMNE